MAAVAVSNAQTREQMKLKEMFEEAYERCRTAPYEGIAFTVEDFHNAIDKYDYNAEIGTKSGLTLNSDGILGPLTTDLPGEGLDFNEIPPAEDQE